MRGDQVQAMAKDEAISSLWSLPASLESFFWLADSRNRTHGRELVVFASPRKRIYEYPRMACNSSVCARVLFFFTSSLG